MVYVRSLLWLLFLLNALKHYSLANRDKNMLEFHKDVIDTSATGKEVVDGIKAGIRGRKMIVEEVKGEKEIEKIRISGESRFDSVKCVKETPFKFSVKRKIIKDNFKLKECGFEDDYHGPKRHTPNRKEENSEIEKSLQGQHWKHYQEHMKKLKVETESSAMLGNPKRKTNYNNGEQDSKKAEEENEKLLDATKQMVSLMNKDYTGYKKAKRKPPINNSLPFP